MDLHPYRIVTRSFLLAPAYLPQTEGTRILHGPRGRADLNGATCQDDIIEIDEAKLLSLDQAPMGMNAYACKCKGGCRDGWAGRKLKYEIQATQRCGLRLLTHEVK